MALADGCKTAVIIGGNIGDNNMDQRSQGFREAFEAGGGNVLDEAAAPTLPSADKAEDMLSANKDADCLYAMVGDYIPGSLSAIDKLGLKGDIKVTCPASTRPPPSISRTAPSGPATTASCWLPDSSDPSDKLSRRASYPRRGREGAAPSDTSL
jgi:hypothetical protein